MTLMDMTGKTALVTGGASGIGAAMVEQLLAAGARVAINYLPGDSTAEQAVEALSDDQQMVVKAPGDVSDADDAPRMVAAAIAELGGLDILINNAGTAGTIEPIPFTDLDAMTEDFWSSILSTNLVGPFRCTRAAASALKARGGCVVNTASIAGISAVGSSIAYGASKAGLINLTRNLARALAPEVRVNAVAPGLTRTPWTNPWPDERKSASIDNTLLKRMVEPTDIAGAMMFLCRSGAITGQAIVIDCGRGL